MSNLPITDGLCKRYDNGELTTLTALIKCGELEAERDALREDRKRLADALDLLIVSAGQQHRMATALQMELRDECTHWTEAMAEEDEEVRGE